MQIMNGNFYLLADKYTKYLQHFQLLEMYLVIRQVFINFIFSYFTYKFLFIDRLLYFVFNFRNIVYNLSISDFTEQRRLVWHSPENDVKMCVMKGKDDVSIDTSMFSNIIYAHTISNSKLEQTNNKFIMNMVNTTRQVIT